MKHRRLTSSRSNICEEGEEGVTNQVSREVKLGDLIWVRLRGSSWWPAQVVDANTVSESVKPSNRSVGEVLVRLYGSYEYLFVDPMKCRYEFEHVLKQNNGSYRDIFHKSLERDRHRLKSSESNGKGSECQEFKVDALTARTVKQNLLEDNQAIIASEYRIEMLEGHPDIGGQLMITQKASLVAETSRDDVSEEEEIAQRSAKYLVNAGTSYQARVSPRRFCARNASPTMERDGFILLDSTEEKLMPYSPHDKKAKNSRTPDKDDLAKKLKTSPLTPTFAAPSSGNSQEMSGRRVKVMQSLGLVAPSGSPFYKFGRSYQFCN